MSVTWKSDAAKKTYRATADCTRGRITAVDGATYTLDGVGDASDIGEGRTRRRDPAGAIVGRDNASGGLGISQQWEVLCPGPLRVAPGGKAAPGAKPAPVAKAPAAAAAGDFAVGEVVEAKYGREWAYAVFLGGVFLTCCAWMWMWAFVWPD